MFRAEHLDTVSIIRNRSERAAHGNRLQHAAATRWLARIRKHCSACQNLVEIDSYIALVSK